MSHVGIVAVSEPSFGGTYPYTLAMIEALRLIPRHRYTLFTTAGNHAYDDLGLPIVRLPGILGSLLRLGANGLRLPYSAGLFAGVDRLIAPIYTTYLLAATQPFAFTLHDLQEKHLPQNFSYAQRLWRHATNLLLTRRAARIICESSHVRGDIARFFGIDLSRIAVIPAPPVSTFRDVELSAEAMCLARNRIGLPEEYLLYPAQFFPHKNHLRLVEAFATVATRYPRLCLVLTGRRCFDYDKVMARAAELKVLDKIRHLGHVDTQDLPLIYKMATLVVIPTLFESVSIPIYEAFAMGVPVCASNVVALPEQIGDAGILFDPLSADDIGDKISGVLADVELQRALVARGKRRIDALTIERYAQQLQKVLEQLG